MFPIIHVTVGNPDWTPTQAELELIRNKIQEEIKLPDFPPPPNVEKSIIHIAAGDEYWNPTNEERHTLIDIFSAAVTDPNGAVIVTRHSVDSKVMFVTKDTEVDPAVTQRMNKYQSHMYGVWAKAYEALNQLSAQMNPHQEDALSKRVEIYLEHLTERIHDFRREVTDEPCKP